MNFSSVSKKFQKEKDNEEILKQKNLLNLTYHLSILFKFLKSKTYK
jgi:hypothetical protein